MIIVLAMVLLFSCNIDFEPKPLNLPQSEEMKRNTRKALLDFNSRRFASEVAMIDSAVQTSRVNAVVRSGGVRVQVQEHSQETDGSPWFASIGDRVVWSWTAYGLDGDSLHSATEEFTIGHDAVPRSFHEAAPLAGDGDSLRFWSPSLSAFGVRGIPGSVAPYTPVCIELVQQRSASDTTWWSQVRQGLANESNWLRSYLQQSPAWPSCVRLNDDVWVSIHSHADTPWSSNEAVLLRLSTSQILDARAIETSMEWNVGAPDQIVPALEAAFSAHPSAQTLTVWSTSVAAFGSDGSPDAGIEAHRPIRFDIEVAPI